jgi:hypothetical protein
MCSRALFQIAHRSVNLGDLSVRTNRVQPIGVDDIDRDLVVIAEYWQAY